MSKFSIKDIENITGIKAHTIRVWEQRYNLATPSRSENNIRYYNTDDLKFFISVSILYNSGIKISRIALFKKEEIEEKVLLLSMASHNHDVQIKGLVTHMINLDEHGFQQALNKTIMHIGLENALFEIIFPFLQHVSVLWLSGAVHPAHEHFILHLIRQKLLVAIDNCPSLPKVGHKKFLLFLPEKEWHDIHLLAAQYIIKKRGHKAIYLGTDTPLASLSSVFSTYCPEYIVSSFTSPALRPYLQSQIDLLSKEWCDAQVLLTGKLLKEEKIRLKLPGNVYTFNTLHEFVGVFEPASVS